MREGCDTGGRGETDVRGGCFINETTTPKLIDCRACCSYKEDVAVNAVRLVISEGFIFIGLKTQGRGSGVGSDAIAMGESSPGFEFMRECH